MPEKTQPRAVILIGFMGAGKTSVGRALAQHLGWPFVDLDDCIEAREQSSIAEIFAAQGEETFRRIESEVLRELVEELRHGPPAVIALGGGAPMGEENAALLAGLGAPQVFLDAPFEVMRARCRGVGVVRPLFQDEERARQLYEKRRPIYLRARYRVDTGSGSEQEAAAEIVAALQLEAQGE